MRKELLILTTLLAAMSIVPLATGAFVRDALTIFFIYLAAAQVWGFMTKHASLVSLGQQIFIGVGGYFTAVLSMYFQLPIWLSIVLAGLSGAAIAALIAYPLLRMRGMYFAIGTLLAAEIFRLFFNSWEFVGAGKGLVFRQAYDVPPLFIYYAAMLLGFLSSAIIYRLYHSKIGIGLRALGSDEEAALSVGIQTSRLKSLLFVYASFIVALAGGINAVNRTYLHPSAAFSISWTVDFLFIAVIGGVGRVLGPVIGGAIFLILKYLFAQYIGLSLLLEGSVALAILLAAPEGVWGIVSRKLKLKLKPPL